MTNMSGKFDFHNVNLRQRKGDEPSSFHEEGEGLSNLLKSKDFKTYRKHPKNLEWEKQSSLARISYVYESILNNDVPVTKKYKEVLRMLWLCLLLTTLILENKKLRGLNKLRTKFLLQEIWSRLNTLLSKKVTLKKEIPQGIKCLYYHIRTRVVQAQTSKLRGTRLRTRLRNPKLFSFQYKNTNALRQLVFSRKERWNDKTWFHYWRNTFKKYLGIGKYDPDLSDRLLFSYIKERKLEIKSKLAFQGIFHKSQELHYSFKKSLDKIHLKSLYVLLKSFFKSINCIISKPLLTFSPDQINILLFFYEKPSLAKALSHLTYKKYLLRKGKLLRHAQFQYKLNKIERRAFMINFITSWKHDESTFKLSLTEKSLWSRPMLKDLSSELTTLAQKNNNLGLEHDQIFLRSGPKQLNLLTRNAFLNVLNLFMVDVKPALEHSKSHSHSASLPRLEHEKRDILSFHKYLNKILLGPNIKRIDKYLSYLYKDLTLLKKKDSLMATRSWLKLTESDLNQTRPILQDLSIWPSALSQVRPKSLSSYKALDKDSSCKELGSDKVMTNLDFNLLKDFEENYFIYVKYLKEMNFLVKSSQEISDLNKTWLDFINVMTPHSKKLNFTWTCAIYLFTLSYLKKIILYLSVFKHVRKELATQKQKYDKNPELFASDKELYLKKIEHAETRTQVLNFLRMNYKDYDYLNLDNLEKVFLRNLDTNFDLDLIMTGHKKICPGENESQPKNMERNTRDLADLVLEQVSLYLNMNTMTFLNPKRLVSLINELEIDFRQVSPFVKYTDLHKFKYTMFLIINALHVLYRSMLCMSLTQNQNVSVTQAKSCASLAPTNISETTEISLSTNAVTTKALTDHNNSLNFYTSMDLESQTKSKILKLLRKYKTSHVQNKDKIFASDKDLCRREVSYRNFINMESLDRLNLERNISGTRLVSGKEVLSARDTDQGLGLTLDSLIISRPSLEHIRNEQRKKHNKNLIISVHANNLSSTRNVKDNTMKSLDLHNKYSDLNKLSLHAHKLYMLRQTLEKIFQKKIKLDLIRLKYPYHESNILTQVLAQSTHKLNFFKMTKLLQNFAVLTHAKNLVSPDLFKVVPSYLSGIKVRLGGRLQNESTRPRKTRQTFQMGCLSRSKVSFTSQASLCRKNKKGAYTFTVTTGHILNK